MAGRTLFALAFGLAASAALPVTAAAVVVLDADFDVDAAEFSYQDDAFRGTSQPSYASGSYDPAGGASGGGLRVELGGINGNDIDEMSGGFTHSFDLAGPEELELRFSYRLTQTAAYESNEWSQTMVSLDGGLLGTGGADFAAEIKGDGSGGSERSTGWRSFRISLGTLGAGSHTLVVGGYNNRKTETAESTGVQIDDLRVATPQPDPSDVSSAALVSRLDLQRFEQNVSTLAGFGTRYWGQPENLQAGDWLESELASYGYTVERHAYPFQGQTRENIYATKVGTSRPDEMFIVSAHMDSFNTQSSGGVFAPGADDDASGSSLVLEAARVFAGADVVTDTSVRFILWNNEETGLDGSEAYVAARRSLQGVESPPGSGQYPEPSWLGVVQHDMILFDHGLPPQAQQIPQADVDVEYQSGGGFVGGAIDLATALARGNSQHSTDYPAEVSSNMNNTDSRSFQDDCPAVSVRENRRLAEIGNGANPHWHKNSDVVATYSAADFLLGFNAVQMTTGTVAELAGATVLELCGNGLLEAGEQCDDGGTQSFDGCDATCQIEGECRDGLDNDGDGDVDHPADPGCLTPDSLLEGTQCDDDLDNDGDGGIDWDGGPGGSADLQCGVPHHLRERAGRCGLGAELGLLIPVLAAARRRRRETAPGRSSRSDATSRSASGTPRLQGAWPAE